MAWMKLLGGGNPSYIFRAFRADGTHRLDLSWSPFAGPGFSFRGRFAHLNREVTANSTNTAGRWYFVQAEFNNTAKTMRLRNRDPLVSFDSGWSQTPTTLGLNTDASTATYKFCVLGADWNSILVDTQIDTLALWDRLLTDAEWDYLYDGGTGIEL